MSRRVFSAALDSPRYRETPTASATRAPRPTTAIAVIGYRKRLDRPINAIASASGGGGAVAPTSEAWETRDEMAGR